MLDLTALEQAALKEICKQQSTGGDVLESQLASAIVTRRKNSGAGFFTYLEVDRATPPLTSAGPLGNVVATIDGFKQPMLLLLFIKDGYAHMLEGATIGDRTVGIDLSTLRFEITEGSSSTAC